MQRSLMIIVLASLPLVGFPVAAQQLGGNGPMPTRPLWRSS